MSAGASLCLAFFVGLTQLAFSAEQISISPQFLRVELASGAQTTATATLHLSQPARFLTAETECRCVTLVGVPPLDLPAGDTRLPISVVGLLPGVKTITLRTTAGAATLAIQVVTPGLGDGRTVLAELARQAELAHHQMVILVHNLNGTLRNCGCSGGSLGGVDHLAALPSAIRARFILTGEIDGVVDGLGAALAERGWEIRPPDVVVTEDPIPALGRADLLAVVATRPVQANHTRLIRPLVAGGAVAQVLLIDERKQVVSQHLLPIDQTLPVDPKILSRFSAPRTLTVDTAATPAQACAACHPAAYTVWAHSGHAQAFERLPVVDRSDACITCHTTALTTAATPRAPGVTCASCHQGAAAHAAAPATRTTGTTDCRSCHDAQHHPSFDPARAWPTIAHGR